MFKPDPLVAATQWQANPLLFTPKLEHRFVNDDAGSLPQVGFERTLFRQTAERHVARVFDNAVGFELADFERPASRAQAVAAAPDPSASAPGVASLLANTAESVAPLAHPSDAETAGPDAGTADLPDSATEAADRPAALDGQPDPDAAASDVHAPLHSQPAWPAETDAASGPEDIEWIRQQAFQLGLQQGWQVALAKGHEQGWEEGHNTGHASGLLEGQIEGQAQAQAMLQADSQALAAQAASDLQGQLALLAQATQAVQQLAQSPEQLFEPFKRLALHLAEQLVLTELSMSGNAIQHLVQRCLAELDNHDQGNITVELNPKDKANLEALPGDRLANIKLLAVAQLKPGSVRVVANEAQVQDLIEHRLETLAHSLLAQPAVWREQSAFFKPALPPQGAELQAAQAPSAGLGRTSHAENGNSAVREDTPPTTHTPDTPDTPDMDTTEATDG